MGQKSGIELPPIKIYYIVSMAFLSFTLLASIGFSWHSYRLQKAQISHDIENSTSHIHHTVSQSLSHLSHLMIFLGEHILSSGPHNLSEITALLQKSSATISTPPYGQSTFTWNNIHNQLVIRTRHGIIHTPKNTARYPYTYFAIRKPWNLYFGSAISDTTSNEWMIPIDFDVADKTERYVGTLSTSLSVDQMNRHLEQTGMPPFVRFIIIDNDAKSAFYSSDTILSSLSQNVLASLLQHLPSAQHSGYLSEPLTLGDVTYTYFFKVKGYPFTILSGYDTDYPLHHVLRFFLSGILLFLSIGFAIFLSLRYFILPLGLVTHAIKTAANGQNITLPSRSKFYEIKHPFFHLLKMQRSYQRLKRHLRMLEKQIDIARIADRAKEKFLKEVLLSRNLPVITPISVSHTLKECIAIHSKYAALHGIHLEWKLQTDLPDLWMDIIHFKQIVTSALYQMMFCLPSHARRAVSIHVESLVYDAVGRPTFLRITMMDNGLGLDEQERARLSAGNSYDSTTLSLETLEHLVNRYHGALNLSSNYGVGTELTIGFCYCDRSFYDSLPPFTLTERIDADFPIATNIIPFPGPRSSPSLEWPPE